jgi:hypothetical protein
VVGEGLAAAVALGLEGPVLSAAWALAMARREERSRAQIVTESLAMVDYRVIKKLSRVLLRPLRSRDDGTSCFNKSAKELSTMILFQRQLSRWKKKPRDNPERKSPEGCTE